jgi:hypothetical protein
MPEKEGGGKLHDIKETASDAVTIVREIGTPSVQETFEMIKEIAVIAKEIMETMKTPEWQQNIENFRIISENMKSVSSRMERTTEGLKETGVIDDTKDLIQTIKAKISSFGGEDGSGGQQSTGEGPGGGRGSSITGQDLKELSNSFKEMLEAVKVLALELRLAIAASKNSGILHNVEETLKEATDTYTTIKGELEEAKK